MSVTPAALVIFLVCPRPLSLHFILKGQQHDTTGVLARSDREVPSLFKEREICPTSTGAYSNAEMGEADP